MKICIAKYVEKNADFIVGFNVYTLKNKIKYHLNS